MTCKLALSLSVPLVKFPETEPGTPEAAAEVNTHPITLLIIAIAGLFVVIW